LVPYWVDQQLEPGTIRLYLSYVRTFCDWIGKHGMVHEPERYVEDPARVKRVYAAKEDRGWKSHGLDPAARLPRWKRSVRLPAVRLRWRLHSHFGPKRPS
jgi:hypothetical protein